MPSDWQVLTALSSVVLRILTYIFLRWIPGHVLPPIIFGSLITYLFAFNKYLQDTPCTQAYSEESTALWSTKNGVNIREKGSILTDSDRRLVFEIDVPPVVDPNLNDDGGTQVATTKEATSFQGERSFQVIKGLIWGLPDPGSLWWNLLILLLHLLLCLMTLDLVYRAPMFHPSSDLSFVKLGHISQTDAYILVREPDRKHLPLKLLFCEMGTLGNESSCNDQTSWKIVDQVKSMSDETDFCHPFRVTGLRSSRTYAYSTSNGFNGTFKTASKIGHFQPDTQKFTFLSSSCIKPHFPYNPIAHPLSIPGFDFVARELASLNPAFMLFLGDWIYVDVPRRLGSDRETYLREYRQVHASPNWPSVSTIPWIHVIDDHEIANDWDKNTTSPFPAAIDAFDIYHGSVNPPAPQSPLGATWRIFSQGPATFFLMDTRRYRKDSSLSDSQGKTMLGELQLHALLDWIRGPVPKGIHWKFVVSSVPFTRNWRVNAQDTWAGYLHERRQILEQMWDASASSQGVGIVILSGDRHEFAATSFPPPQDSRWPVSATVHEFSASPLSMFYLPFRSYWEDNEQALIEGLEEDICIKYIPDGNSKFGAIEIDKEVGGERSRLNYRLFVDGKETWSYNVMSPPKARESRVRDAVWA